MCATMRAHLAKYYRKDLYMLKTILFFLIAAVIEVIQMTMLKAPEQKEKTDPEKDMNLFISLNGGIDEYRTISLPAMMMSDASFIFGLG